MTDAARELARMLLDVPEHPNAAPDIATLLATVGVHDPIVGSAVCAGPQGAQRLALTASGADRLVGGIGIPGRINAIVVRRRATVFETANAVLAAVAQWTGYTLGYKPVANPDPGAADGGRVLIDIDRIAPYGPAEHADAPLALAAWVTIMNTLLADASPRVLVSVLGFR